MVPKVRTPLNAHTYASYISCRLAPLRAIPVFALDVTVCPACGGRLRLIAALTDPASVRRYLQGVGLPTEPSPLDLIP